MRHSILYILLGIFHFWYFLEFRIKLINITARVYTLRLAELPFGFFNITEASNNT